MLCPFSNGWFILGDSCYTINIYIYTVHNKISPASHGKEKTHQTKK